MDPEEIVKMIEAEDDDGGDILEELSEEDIRDIYYDLSDEDKRRFRQFQQFHPQYFGVYGEHLPSYHMARQVVRDLMPSIPSAAADTITAKRAEILVEDRLRVLCRMHGFKFPEKEMRVEAPQAEVVKPFYRFPSIQDEYQTGMSEETVDNSAARVANDMGTIKGWHHVIGSFDRSQIALVLAVGIRRMEEFEILKCLRPKEDVTPFLRLAKMFGRITQTVQECYQGHKYRYSEKERGPQTEPPKKLQPPAVEGMSESTTDSTSTSSTHTSTTTTVKTDTDSAL